MRALRLSLALLILLSPGAVLAQTAPHNFQELAGFIVTLLNNATTVLIVAGLAIYFYGISTNILKFGDGDKEKFRNYFLWGIIVLFLMVSIWGILRLLQDSLFGGSGTDPSSGAPTQTQDQFGTPHFLE